jgi:hypothetical protein
VVLKSKVRRNSKSGAEVSYRCIDWPRMQTQARVVSDCVPSAVPRGPCASRAAAWATCRKWGIPALRSPGATAGTTLSTATAAALAALVAASSPVSAAIETYSLAPIEDFAKVVPKEAKATLEAKIEALEKDTGYKIRVLTQYTGTSGGRQNANIPTSSELKVGWQIKDDLNDKYVVVFVDPSAPNVLGFKYSKEVQMTKLPRPFFTELQSRYGNMFYQRENGEYKALEESLDALDTCLRRENGCAVPPGLPEEQYFFTLLCSVLGGGILGASLRIDPVGFVKRRWVYALLFSPLWITLSVSYGLGPVTSRTDSLMPVIANVGATIAAAALIANYKQAADAVGLSVSSTLDEE